MLTPAPGLCIHHIPVLLTETSLPSGLALHSGLSSTTTSTRSLTTPQLPAQVTSASQRSFPSTTHPSVLELATVVNVHVFV